MKIFNFLKRKCCHGNLDNRAVEKIRDELTKQLGAKLDVKLRELDSSIEELRKISERIHRVDNCRDDET